MADDNDFSLSAFTNSKSEPPPVSGGAANPPQPSLSNFQKIDGDNFSLSNFVSAGGTKATDTVSPLSNASNDTNIIDKPSGFSLSAFNSKSSSQSELDKPETHQLENKSDPSDPNDPWYKKMWDSANAPLFDAKTAQSWFGWDVDHWNGWGKGLFDLASGLTSPLSIGLAVGTFGTSSLIESGGMAALKAAGMGAEEIAQVTKGSDILAKAVRMGHDTEAAYGIMSGFGVDPAIVKTGLDTLAKSGMKAEAMLANGVIRRTGAGMLRAAGVDLGTAEKVGSFAQFALDAGFTAQNAYGAVVAAPQVLDAIKEGDFDTAKRLMIDAIGSGTFAVLGGSQLHQHAGELMTDVEAAAGLRVKPSDENIKLMKLIEPIERERIVAGEREKTWEQSARKEFKIKPDKDWIAGGSSESDLRARFHRESDGNLEGWHDAIADAAGRPDEKIVKADTSKPADTKPLFDLLEQHDTIKDHRFRNATAPNEVDRLASYQQTQLGSLISKTEAFAKNNNLNRDEFAVAIDKAKDALSKANTASDSNEAVKHQDNALSFVHRFLKDAETETKSKVGLASNLNSTEDVARLQQAASKKLFNKDYSELTDFKDKMAAIREATDMQTKEKLAKADTSFPPSIQDAIDSGKLKDKPKGYIDQLLKATDPRLLTDDEVKYSKHAGLHFDETGTRAVGAEALQGLSESYVTRVFKNANDVDSVKKFRSTASSPNFSVDTAMARKRVFETTLEGVLNGHELENHDMIALAAHNGNEFSRIVSNREALSRLRGAGAKASDGRPMAALSGSGHVVEGFDEKGNAVNPATIINPKAMQSIRMADKVVEGLKKNISKKGVDEVKGQTSSTSSTVTPEAFLKRVGEAKGVMERHNTELEGKFKDAKEWPSDVPPVKLMLDEGGNVIEADGRYRASLANQAGIERIPVEVSRPVPDVKGVPDVTQLDKLIKEGRIVKYGVDKRNGKDLYAWTTHDYRTVDNPAFRGWKVPTTDTEGNPVMVQSELKVHPEAHEYLQRRFGADEGLKIPGKKYLMGAGSEAKGWLLAFSPFHFVQEGLRAVMTGISPIGSEHFNPDNPMHVLAAEKGVWSSKDYKGVRTFEDGLVGHSKTMAKIPVLREIQSWTQSMLFDRYIPGLKLRGFERMMEANKSVHPEWTKEKLANESAAEVNERFGGIDYKRMGRSASMMDIARLTTLAPDWLESEMRFMKRTFSSGGEGAVARRDVLKMTMGLWAAARVLNYVTTGKAHNEAPFGVAYKDSDGREKVYSIRTMPSDMLHAVSDPTGFMNGRVAPLLKTGIQTYTGRDEFGRKMDRNGIFVNLLRNVSPIAVQSAVKQATGQDTEGITSTDSVAKAAGLTVFPYRTEAQKLAAKIASDHSESGVVDKDKLRRHQGVIEIEDRVRQGKMPITDVYKAVEAGQLHVDEAKKIQKNIQETAGMDNDMARLYLHASRLPLPDMIKVWESAGNEEKMALAKLLLKKKTAYLKKSYKEMSPSERQSDKTYQWIRRTFPQDSPF